jgi:hypothetical protein
MYLASVHLYLMSHFTCVVHAGNMSQKIYKNKDLLKHLSKCSSPQRKAIIRTASPDQINSICECILNVYNRNIPLKRSAYTHLKPYHSEISQLSLKRRSALKTKRKLLNQRGGAFVPILLASVLPYVIDKLCRQ